jgi:hypothetical protein
VPQTCPVHIARKIDLHWRRVSAPKRPSLDGLARYAADMRRSARGDRTAAAKDLSTVIGCVGPAVTNRFETRPLRACLRPWGVTRLQVIVRDNDVDLALRALKRKTQRGESQIGTPRRKLARKQAIRHGLITAPKTKNWELRRLRRGTTEVLETAQ